ncbi:MAG: class F sortase [Dehalococcoidia bacterium]|nr:class F sortase [Dehalococcoidia bacterium]
MTSTVEQADQGGSPRWKRLSLFIMTAGVAALAGAAILFVLTLTGTIGQKGYSGPGTSTTFGDVSFLLTPQPTPVVPPSEAPIARIAIPKFKVDAPVVIRGVDANRVMETPDGPVDVAWYEFTSRPGFGSNAVFSGHVDYINYGPAVFWHLKDLQRGDMIELRLQDGTVYKYRVVTREQVGADPSQEKLEQIVGPTEKEIVTLITCGGSFDGSQYDQRVIVRAERINEGAPPPAASSQS